MLFVKMSIMLIIVLRKETKTKHGLHTECIVIVLCSWGSEALESKSLLHLVFQWLGESQKNMEKNVTFAHVLL